MVEEKCNIIKEKKNQAKFVEEKCNIIKEKKTQAKVVKEKCNIIKEKKNQAELVEEKCNIIHEDGKKSNLMIKIVSEEIKTSFCEINIIPEEENKIGVRKQKNVSEKEKSC